MDRRKPLNSKLIKAVVLGVVLVMGAIALTNNTVISRSPEAESPQVANQPFTDRDTPLNFDQTWIVSATAANTLIDQGATVLDARSNRWLGLERLPGSVPVSWPDFSPNHATRKGNLLDNPSVLTQKLRKLGIANDRPVVVFADPQQGWGEDGRLVWMLRTLGHRQAVMVDGGYAALVATHPHPNPNPPPGDFVIHRNANWQIRREDLKSALGNLNSVIIDTRTPQEYAGATPHGENRKGHLPGAVNLHFRSLLNQRGKLLPRDQILARLQKMGITKDTQIVAYCTGGIRSGWLTVVLSDLGFEVKNYAGSMWEWAAGPSQDYPLTVES